MARKQTRNEEYTRGFPSGMEAFAKLSDPRNGRAKRHYFGEVRDLFADPGVLAAARVAGQMEATVSSQDKGHGRVEEERHLTVTNHLDWLEPTERRAWLDLCSLVHLRSVRHLPDGSRSVEDRY